MLNVIEYNSLLFNSSIQKKEEDVMHFRMGGEKKNVRRYQNLDGSLTPLGRIHYGIGMSREEQRAAREAEDRRQEEIDYNRSKSIREMDDRELQEAVNRSRNEMMFEQNMQMRATNFLSSRNTEERLNQEYDELMYQKSRQKAERWMGRVERLGRFVGNLATTYGKIEDVKGKIQDTRAKRALADKNEWLAEQEHTKYDQGQWNFKKNVKEYEASKAAKAAEKEAEKEAKKEAKREAKAEKASRDEVKQSIVSKVFGKKKDKETKASDPEYIKKEGDRYIYSDSTMSKWKSTKEPKMTRAEKKAAAKREALKEQTKREISEMGLDRTGRSNAGNWSYFSQKAAKEAKQQSIWNSVHKHSAGTIISDAAARRKKMRKR